MSNTAVAETAKPKPAPAPPKKAEAPKPAAPKPAEAPKIVVRSGIPIPAHGGGLGMESKYPWDQMNPGDSFFVAGATIRQMSGLASSTGKRMTKRLPSGSLPVKFTARTYKDGNVDGVMVWRIS